ncbi:MAG: UDP-Gal:alpha-D-GlcNAc-diphosphoundecaprenol beta-1,3-galactosyltransferase [Bacteroidetes bacterium ADurb.Bin302]|nr:MAG: UDP-Gal:alpha-D-GlcNAc-diphosphoundecaprenol beta-1,3-galactosyltransferase [Bacteroidetes bacterium ADurb.Bin302]
MFNREKLAIILPVYKNDKAGDVRLSINSVLNQTYEGPIFLYIGVDGPIGEDLKICLKEFEIKDTVNISWFSENRLQMKYLSEHPNIDVVGGTIEEIDEDGNLRGKIIVYPESPDECREFFSKRNPHAHPAVLFRKSFFDKLNGKKYRPEYRQNQDTMLWYDGMMAGTQHANIPDVVLNFRMTNAMFKKRRNGWAFAKKQFKDRLMINKGLGYGFGADVYGFAMFCMLISPVWVKKIAYRIFR